MPGNMPGQKPTEEGKAELERAARVSDAQFRPYVGLEVDEHVPGQPDPKFHPETWKKRKRKDGVQPEGTERWMVRRRGGKFAKAFPVPGGKQRQRLYGGKSSKKSKKKT